MEVTFTRVNSSIIHPTVCFLWLRRYPLCFLIPGALTLFLFNHATRAAEFSKVLKPYASYTTIADDNILRIRDNFDPQNIESPRIRDLVSQGKLADVSHRMTGGVIFQKEISRQRLSADLSWTYNKFQRFHEMDNDLKNFRGNWHWFLGNKLEGNMGASYVQSLMPFVFQPGIKTIRTEQTQFINAAWHFHPRWRLNGEYTHYDLDNDNKKIERLQYLNRVENRFEGGIDYITPNKNTVGVLFRGILGNFKFPVDLTPDNLLDNSFANNDYDQKEVLGKINWIVTAKSTLQGTAGWVERQNASFKERDFSGFNGRLTYHWQPTEKLGLTINGWRLTATAQNITAGFSLNTGTSVIPSWNITEKVRLEGEFSYETRNFNRFSIFTDPILPLGRHNTLRNAMLKLAYTPYQGLQLSTSIYHSDISTDAALGGFNANGVNANLQYVYGQR
jgi:exopolysaccharide biosynthesis operon protein EpsL